MTVAGRTPGFYLVAFSLVSVFLILVERLVTGYHTFPYVITQAIVGIILIIIAAILTSRWSKNPDNTPLAIATAIVNILLFIIGDVTISSSVLAVALWVVYRSFSMRACLGLTIAFIIFSPIPHMLRHHPAERVIQEFIGATVLFILYLFLAWFLASLEASAERERALAIEAAVSKEQTAAARMLHDGLGQQLVAITMSFNVAKALKPTNEEAAWEEMAHAHTVANQALTDLRRWVRALDPPTTPTPHTTNQLVEIMKSLSQTFSSTGLEFRITPPPDDRPLPTPIGEILHIAAHEGVANALRHGHPTTIHFHLSTTDDTVTLMVEDHGDPTVTTSTSEKPEGYGLRSLRERAEHAGGTMTATPTPTGFQLTTILPLREA